MNTRKECYLAKLKGEYSGELPEPRTRQEQYLAQLCGVYSGELPEPRTRQEQYLYHISKNGGIGGGVVKKIIPKEMEVDFDGVLGWTSV